MENHLIQDFKKKIGAQNTNQNNTISTDNSNININANPLKYIYDEEFISSINGLSTSIKNYFQNNKLYLGNIKLISENINEQTLFSKSVINDIIVYFNQMAKARYNNMNINLNLNEKYIKEKMKIINERIEKIDEFKTNMLQNIKNCEIAFLSFYEEAKNLFKKMKIIRTEKIENLTKKILVNKNSNFHNNNLNNTNNTISITTNNNLSLHKRHKTVSHSPSQKNHLNNKTKLIQKKADNKNSHKIISNIKNISNEDLNEIKSMKIKYIELLQENKRLKEDLIIMNKNNNSRSKKKVNTICSSTPSKELSSVVKRSTSATKKKYIQKPISIGNLNNKNINKKINKSISHSRTQTQAQTQSHITNTLSSLADEENNNKLIKSIGKKSELIPIGSGGGIDRENNILSISKNSVDISMGTGAGIGGSCRNNILNNINNSTSANTLASMVLSFLKEMRNLQENITKKVSNIKELKKNFELKKRQLKKFSENIVENNLSSTYGGNNINNLNNLNNLMNDYSKIKSKEQSVKASIESFNTKDNNNYNDMIREYEIKNKEQNKIIQNKEKEIEILNKEIIDKSKKIEQIENDLKSKEDKIKTEKEISNLKDEKLNSEKELNNKMTEELTELKNKNEKMGKELEEAKNSINNLEKINNELNEIKTQQNKKINEMNINLNNYNSLNKELDKMNKDNTLLKNENINLKEQISQCNNNLALITNKNNSNIHEKEKMIKSLKQTNLDLNKRIETLYKEISEHENNLSQSKILIEEISSLKKNNDSNQEKILKLEGDNRQLKNRMADIKTNYVSHHEDFKNIKAILTELNNKTESNLKKIKENEKKVNIYTSTQAPNLGNGIDIKNNVDNKNNDENKSIEDLIKNINNNMGEYNLLIEEIKNYNNCMNQISNE